MGPADGDDRAAPATARVVAERYGLRDALSPPPARWTAARCVQVLGEALA